ncbi:putative pentatricopeptide repeat-containing protein At5g08310, mitochondrial [Panicum virgatum]|uniref:putative pentatricopeptide repeat-containing protein At5g08310, mitochondrial n=1 Tax=Panicum virgatum TaxID=38727 RepID=UPI0019D56384|nr:putative pentatricopeptide repeat-containing protein At5g08310, mitochondrial [Panicum virgatum]
MPDLKASASAAAGAACTNKLAPGALGGRARPEQPERRGEATPPASPRAAEGVKPNCDSFNIVVCGLYRLDEAYEMFNKMKDLGLKPSVFTYNSLFHGISRRKDPSAAIDLLREMRTNGHKPCIKNCTEMVQQLCFSGKITEALQFLDEMLIMGFLPDIVTYSAAMNGMCKFDEAQEIMEEMLSKGLFPSVVTYNLMIDIWSQSGRIDKAIACLNKMSDEEKPPTCDRIETALSYYEEMKAKAKDVIF